MGRKIMVLFQTAAILLIITACSSSADKEAQKNQALQETKDLSVYEPEAMGSHALNEETATNPTPCISYEVSDKEAAIYYEGEDFRKSVFSVGGEMLYIYGIKPDESCFLGCMGKEETQFREIPVEIPENMRVSYMTVDSAGSGHMLWISTETTVVDGIARNLRTYEKVLITEIDKSGEVKKNIDVTELFDTEQLRLNYYCFGVDNEGSYYLGCGQEIIKLSSDGELTARIPCEGTIQAVSCGRSGEVYCIYGNENKEEIIGRVEQQNSTAVISQITVLSPADALYLYLASGTDTELLLYNKAGGVYACDVEAGTARQRISAGELPVSGVNVNGYGFLGDGRLCLLTEENGKAVFYYVPYGNIVP